MSFERRSCGTSIPLTAAPSCSIKPGIVRRLVLAFEPSYFTSKATAEDKDVWIDAICGKANAGYVGGQLFPTPIAVVIEDTSTEVTVEDVSPDQKTFINAGTTGGNLRLKDTTDWRNFKELVKFRGKKVYGFIVHDNGQVRGKTTDGVTFEAIEMSVAYAAKLTPATTETAEYASFVYSFRSEEFDNFGAEIAPNGLATDPWSAKDELYGILPVVAELDPDSTPTTSEIKFLLQSGYVIGEGISQDPAAVAALDETDFDVSSGTVTTIVTGQNNLGLATISGTFSAGTVEVLLKDPSETGQRYKQLEALDVPIL